MELSLKGFKDLLPAEMIARDKIVAIIKSVFESYGFVPIATPALEFKRVLLAYSDLTAEFTKDEFDSFLAEYPQTRKTLQPFVRENRSIVSVRISDLSIKTQNELGEEAYERIIDQTVPDKQIYTFREPEGKAVGLKFDLTVPMSRFVAEHKELPRPFKRYQFQPVWRFDKPDPGRFREFAQFDIDTVGTKDMAADAEIIAAMNDSLAKLGVNYRIRFSTRKALNSLLKYAGINEAASHAVFKIIDKLKKQGIESVEQELGHGRSDASGDEIKGLGLEADQIRRIRGFLEISQPTRSETIVTLEKFFANVAGAGEEHHRANRDPQAARGTGHFRRPNGRRSKHRRGLDYYTGPVFEAVAY
jgi:histidyl-tRNA synthetase